VRAGLRLDMQNSSLKSVGATMMLLALPPADHLLIERDRGQFVPSRRRCMMANVRAERLLKIPAEPSPELRVPGTAAQTRVVSVSGIRLGSAESARAFKGIICDDISQFESSHPSHAVGLLQVRSPAIGTNVRRGSHSIAARAGAAARRPFAPHSGSSLNSSSLVRAATQPATAKARSLSVRPRTRQRD
jgi:hypothetical protein